MIELKAETKTLTCSCCDLPFAHLRRQGDGAPVLVIASRHKGDHHTNVVTADDLRRWLAEMERGSSRVVESVHGG